MPRQTIKLVVSDVDGTMVTQEKVLTTQARHAVQDILDAGAQFSIVSGRPPRGMQHLIPQLPLQKNTPIAAFNGSIIMDIAENLLEVFTIDPKHIDLILETLKENGQDIWIYTADNWYTQSMDVPHMSKEIKTVQFEPTVVKDWKDVDLTQVVKITSVSDDEAKIAASQKSLQRVLGDYLTIKLSQSYYLDITDLKGNKGALIQNLSKRLNIPTEQIATLGDMQNDVAMFQDSGLSIAMGQAQDEVKRQATHVTASNEENGFAQAVHEFILAACPKRTASV